MSLPYDAEELRANIAIMREMLPTVDHMDKPYYEQRLQEMSNQLGKFYTEEGLGSESPFPWGFEEDSSSSPPPILPSNTLKRGLEPNNLPEAKRSRQPSPDNAGSLLNQWPQSLPRRQSNPVQQSSQAFIDLTQSDPPTPVRSPQLRAQDGTFLDPFAELYNAFTGEFANGHSILNSNLNTNYMSELQLAEFISRSQPGHSYGYGYGYGYQPQPHAFLGGLATGFNGLPPGMRVPGMHPRPHFWGADSDFDDYDSPNFHPTEEAKAIEKLLENFKGDSENAEERAPTPAIMTCTLKEYQRIGLSWLLKMERGNNKGGILADDMGLGKTIQALSLMCANPSNDPTCKTTLIIAPVALMRQWEKEIERHIDPHHKYSVYLYHGTGKNVDFARLRQYDVVLTTFGSLTWEFKQIEDRKESLLHEQEAKDSSIRRKPKDKLSLLGPECMWYRIIIDEAHNIKNRNGKTSKACAELMAKHRLCMTGTPMMNNIGELYPLIRFLKVKPYCSWKKFNDDILKHMKNRFARSQGMDRVRVLLASLMLRRQKDAKVDGQPISKIPPKHIVVDNVDFSQSERGLYRALEMKSQRQMERYIEEDAVSSNYANVLVLLLRLRQVCCHPQLIKDLSQPATDGIAEYDLLTRARGLNEDVVFRLKEQGSFECPICFEADPNPTIIIPCGHTVCGECVQKLIDPTMRAAQEDNDEIGAPKCPHCRGELRAKLITDYKHFCKVHCRERLGSADLEDEDGDSDADSEDSDSDSEDGDTRGVDKKGNLAGFIVDDDDEEEEEEEEDDDDDDDDDEGVEKKEVEEEDTSASKAKSKGKKPKKRSKGKGKGKGKGKARANPKMTLAQLKKESLRNKAAKKRYIRRLDKIYIPSAKINRTIQILQEIRANDPTEKTLVFSQFTSLLDLVEVPLNRAHMAYQRYDGSMKMDARADAVNAFMHDPTQNVMLVSLKAGNAGLNLWKASQVIILDPFWNPFIEDQAVDRAHRMPQTREVFVHRVLVPDTVEDRITKLQDDKREMIGAALDENEGKNLTRLNVRELRFLFGMK